MRYDIFLIVVVTNLDHSYWTRVKRSTYFPLGMVIC